MLTIEVLDSLQRRQSQAHDQIRNPTLDNGHDILCITADLLFIESA